MLHGRMYLVHDNLLAHWPKAKDGTNEEWRMSAIVSFAIFWWLHLLSCPCLSLKVAQEAQVARRIW